MNPLGCCALFCRSTTVLHGSNEYGQDTREAEYSETTLLAAFLLNCPSQVSFLPTVTKITTENKPGKVIKNPLLQS